MRYDAALMRRCRECGGSKYPFSVDTEKVVAALRDLADSLEIKAVLLQDICTETVAAVADFELQTISVTFAERIQLQEESHL